MRRQRPRCLGPDSTLYIRCPPSLPPSSPSNSIQTREFPPPHQPPVIHLSLHSSLFSPTNENNNTQQHNNQQVRRPSFLRPHIQISALEDDGSFDQTSQVGPNGWKEIRLNHAKNVTGRFWCGLAILSASEFRTVQANSRDACVNASIRCRRQSWFCITLD